MRFLTVLRPANWVGLAVFTTCYVGYPLFYSCARRFGRRRLRCHVCSELRQAVAQDVTLAQHTRNADTILHYLDHLDLDFSRGIRTLYYLSVLFLWFIGSELFLAGSLILTLMIYRFDFMKSRY